MPQTKSNDVIFRNRIPGAMLNCLLFLCSGITQFSEFGFRIIENSMFTSILKMCIFNTEDLQSHRTTQIGKVMKYCGGFLHKVFEIIFHTSFKDFPF